MASFTALDCDQAPALSQPSTDGGDLLRVGSPVPVSHSNFIEYMFLPLTGRSGEALYTS